VRAGEGLVNGNRLRAPLEDGGVVASPDLSGALDLAEKNRRLLEKLVLPGITRAEIRQEVLAASAQYHDAAQEPLPTSGAPDLVFMAGHQPELFHPGVWIKNYALAGLAAEVGGTALNLIVDTDVPKTNTIRVPVGSADPKEAIVRVPFDAHAPDVPFEERQVHDQALWRQFPDSVATRSRTWTFRAIFFDFWSEVTAVSSRTPLLGERWARARRSWERSWSCHNLELPQSAVCRTRAFASFFCYILRQASAFHAAHNASLAQYRKTNGIRGPGRPVPDLAADADWLELPFWIWETSKSKRRRLLVRVAASGSIALRMGQGAVVAEIPNTGPCDHAVLQELEQQGVKIRTRALMTTMFARLFLCDLFIHGLGGAMYDEITDDIIRRFWHIEPPRFIVLSGSLRLPFRCSPGDVAESRRLRQLSRDLQWNPDRHLANVANDEKARRLADEKAHWISMKADSSARRRDRFLHLRRLNGLMQPLVADEAASIGEKLALCERQVDLERALCDRDFAFCLYPESRLRPFCQRFLRPGDCPAAHDAGCLVSRA
jgi:hypothetical protein